MSKFRTIFRGSISAMVVATGVGFGAVILAAASLAPAYAQGLVLSSAQISAIQTSLRSALGAATSDADKSMAIKNAILSAVALYGSGAVSSITATVVHTAEESRIADVLIGYGVAEAAITLAAASTQSGNDVASVVGNEGNLGERSSCQLRATSLGYANIASLCNKNPEVTGGTGGGGIGTGGTGGGFTGGGAAGGGGGGCLNPSCTHL